MSGAGPFESLKGPGTWDVIHCLLAAAGHVVDYDALAATTTLEKAAVERAVATARDGGLCYAALEEATGLSESRLMEVGNLLALWNWLEKDARSKVIHLRLNLQFRQFYSVLQSACGELPKVTAEGMTGPVLGHLADASTLHMLAGILASPAGMLNRDELSALFAERTTASQLVEPPNSSGRASVLTLSDPANLVRDGLLQEVWSLSPQRRRIAHYGLTPVCKEVLTRSGWPEDDRLVAVLGRLTAGNPLAILTDPDDKEELHGPLIDLIRDCAERCNLRRPFTLLMTLTQSSARFLIRSTTVHGKGSGVLPAAVGETLGIETIQTQLAELERLGLMQWYVNGDTGSQIWWHHPALELLIALADRTYAAAAAGARSELSTYPQLELAIIRRQRDRTPLPPGLEGRPGRAPGARSVRARLEVEREFPSVLSVLAHRRMLGIVSELAMLLPDGAITAQELNRRRPRGGPLSTLHEDLRVCMHWGLVEVKARTDPPEYRITVEGRQLHHALVDAVSDAPAVDDELLVRIIARQLLDPRRLAIVQIVLSRNNTSTLPEIARRVLDAERSAQTSPDAERGAQASPPSAAIKESDVKKVEPDVRDLCAAGWLIQSPGPTPTYSVAEAIRPYLVDATRPSVRNGHRPTLEAAQMRRLLSALSEEGRFRMVLTLVSHPHASVIEVAQRVGMSVKETQTILQDLRREFRGDVATELSRGTGSVWLKADSNSQALDENATRAMEELAKMISAARRVLPRSARRLAELLITPPEKQLLAAMIGKVDARGLPGRTAQDVIGAANTNHAKLDAAKGLEVLEAMYLMGATVVKPRRLLVIKVAEQPSPTEPLTDTQEKVLREIKAQATRVRHVEPQSDDRGAQPAQELSERALVKALPLGEWRVRRTLLELEYKGHLDLQSVRDNLFGATAGLRTVAAKARQLEATTATTRHLDGDARTHTRSVKRSSTLPSHVLKGISERHVPMGIP